MRTRSLVIAVLLLLFAAACGSSTTDESVATSSDASETETANPQAEAPAPSEADEEPAVVIEEPDEAINSPIAELFGLPVSDSDSFEEQIEEIGRNIERSVATCMLAQGFEYTPVDIGAVSSAVADIDFESRAFAEEWGFGIATGFSDLFFGESGIGVDPNVEYVNSLSAGEREAYQQALYGVDFTEEAAFSPTFEPAGCLGEAFESSTQLFVLFETFGDELESFEDAYEADPRIVDSASEWSGCMAGAGYSYNDTDAAYNDIQTQFEAIVSGELGEPSFDEPETDPETGELLLPSLSPETQAEVDALGDVEREIAVASWDCSEPQRQIEDEVRIEYERQFVEEYGDAVRAELGN